MRRKTTSLTVLAVSRFFKNFELLFHEIEPFDHLKTLSYFKDIASMTSQLSALDGTDNFNYLMALQDICSRIDSDSDSRRNSVAANSNDFFSPFFSFLFLFFHRPQINFL